MAGTPTKQDLTAKLVGIAASAAAVWAVNRLVDSSWSRATGHKPPKPEDEGDIRFGEVAAAALITGALVSLARVLAARGAARLLH